MEETNIINIIKDGDPTRIQGTAAPSKGDLAKPNFEGSVRKKRRRGKYKRKIMKPIGKVAWQDRWKKDKPKRNNRFRKIVLAKTQAPFNNNQFLMEIHKPEPENSFNIMQTPSARTRDSSFSIDSEDNYFYSLPEDEEEYLTKEFSSVYEDAQSERLSNMSKNELIQEYLLLEAKYDNLVKRTERLRTRPIDEDTFESDKETSATDKDSMVTEKDNSGTSLESSVLEDPRYIDLLQRMKEQEEQVHQLQLANEKLRLENEHMHQRTRVSSSEDSESDSSSSSSDSDSSSSESNADVPIEDGNGSINDENNAHVNGQIEATADTIPAVHMVNGFHTPD